MSAAKYWTLELLEFLASDEYCRFDTYEPRFIRPNKAEVSKRQYSSKANSTNVREGG
jgi:hypothetical protein